MIKKPDNLSVLIIENNHGDFVLIEDYLIEKFNTISITHCNTFETAARCLSEHKDEFSVILLSLDLPDLGGLELIKNLLPLSAQIPVIILTGYADLELAKRSLKMGIFDFWIKDEANAEIAQKSILHALSRTEYKSQLEDAKMSYENLFNFSPQPMWLIDCKTLKFLNANFAAVEKYGFTLEEFLSKSFLDIHPKEEKKAIQLMLENNRDKALDNHFTHFLKNGEEIKIEINFSKMWDVKNNGYIILANDITENLNFINIIQNRNTKLKNIAWTQSHVVRTPLSRILGILNLIESQDEQFEDLPFLLKQLRVSADEMDDIVKKIVYDTKIL